MLILHGQIVTDRAVHRGKASAQALGDVLHAKRRIPSHGASGQDGMPSLMQWDYQRKAEDLRRLKM